MYRMWFVGSFFHNISSHHLIQSRILICWFSIIVIFNQFPSLFRTSTAILFGVWLDLNNEHISINWHERVWFWINNSNPLFSCHAGMFTIITFEEFISIALDADRTVGIYPEMKDPVFINKHVSPLVLMKKYALHYDLLYSLVISLPPKTSA